MEKTRSQNTNLNMFEIGTLNSAAVSLLIDTSGISLNKIISRAFLFSD